MRGAISGPGQSPVHFSITWWFTCLLLLFCSPRLCFLFVFIISFFLSFFLICPFFWVIVFLLLVVGVLVTRGISGNVLKGGPEEKSWVWPPSPKQLYQGCDGPHCPPLGGTIAYNFLLLPWFCSFFSCFVSFYVSLLCFVFYFTFLFSLFYSPVLFPVSVLVPVFLCCVSFFPSFLFTFSVSFFY